MKLAPEREKLGRSMGKEARVRGNPRLEGFEAAPKTCGSQTASVKIGVGGCPRTLRISGVRTLGERDVPFRSNSGRETGGPLCVAKGECVGRAVAGSPVLSSHRHGRACPARALSARAFATTRRSDARAGRDRIRHGRRRSASAVLLPNWLLPTQPSPRRSMAIPSSAPSLLPTSPRRRLKHTGQRSGFRCVP